MTEFGSNWVRVGGRIASATEAKREGIPGSCPHGVPLDRRCGQCSPRRDAQQYRAEIERLTRERDEWERSHANAVKELRFCQRQRDIDCAALAARLEEVERALERFRKYLDADGRLNGEWTNIAWPLWLLDDLVTAARALTPKAQESAS